MDPHICILGWKLVVCFSSYFENKSPGTAFDSTRAQRRGYCFQMFVRQPHLVIFCFTTTHLYFSKPAQSLLLSQNHHLIRHAHYRKRYCAKCQKLLLQQMKLNSIAEQLIWAPTTGSISKEEGCMVLGVWGRRVGDM